MFHVEHFRTRNRHDCSTWNNLRLNWCSSQHISALCTRNEPGILPVPSIHRRNFLAALPSQPQNHVSIRRQLVLGPTQNGLLLPKRPASDELRGISRNPGKVKAGRSNLHIGQFQFSNNLVQEGAFLPVGLDQRDRQVWACQFDCQSREPRTRSNVGESTFCHLAQ